MLILSIVLGVFLLVSIFVIWNLLRKIEKSEDIITDQVEYLQNISYLIKESKDFIEKTDEKGIFRADDEVGTFFGYMKQIQDTANSYILPAGYGEKKK